MIGYIFSMGVDFKHPEITCKVLFTVTSTLFAFAEFYHTGTAYSAADKLNDSLDVHRIECDLPRKNL